MPRRGAPGVFTLSLRVPPEDIDRMGHVNNVAFVRYVQDAAAAHWLSLAPAYLQAAYVWVVRRHEIEYLKPGRPDDELLIRTWVVEPSGATWDRFTEITRPADDTLLVEARTVWVLLDAVTGRPRRIDSRVAGVLPRGKSLPASPDA
jgi:acyl-CoA thioester hydrolase